jgi:hypothetical protein
MGIAMSPTTPMEQLIDDAMKHWLSGDLASAESLLLEAAKTGNGLAAHNLGTLYDEFTPVTLCQSNNGPYKAHIGI